MTTAPSPLTLESEKLIRELLALATTPDMPGYTFSAGKVGPLSIALIRRYLAEAFTLGQQQGIAQERAARRGREISCEGCDTATYRAKDFPAGWTQIGRSRKHPGRLASWCPSCHALGKQRDHHNPSEAETKALREKMRRPLPDPPTETK